MRLLTDENIDAQVVDELRKDDHNILDVKETELHATEDGELLALASREQRVVITHDKDFIDLCRRYTTPPSAIIVLPANQSVRQILARLRHLFGKHEKLFRKPTPCVIILKYNRLEIYPLA